MLAYLPIDWVEKVSLKTNMKLLIKLNMQIIIVRVTGNIFFTYHTFIDDNEVKPGMELLKKLYKGEKE